MNVAERNYELAGQRKARQPPNSCPFCPEPPHGLRPYLRRQKNPSVAQSAYQTYSPCETPKPTLSSLRQKQSAYDICSTNQTALSSGQTQSITPSSSANLIRLSAAGTLGVPASGTGSLRFARGSTGLATAEAGAGWAGTGTGAIPVSLVTYDFPASLTSVTYGFQGAVNTGTLSYTYAAYGAILEVQEIMA
jgi:hypothetical protein